MNSINNIPESEFNWKTLVSMRYDEERGVVRVYYIRGKLIVEDYNGRYFL
jgi:hypothetical protein